MFVLKDFNSAALAYPGLRVVLDKLSAEIYDLQVQADSPIERTLH